MAFDVPSFWGFREGVLLVRPGRWRCWWVGVLALLVVAGCSWSGGDAEVLEVGGRGGGARPVEGVAGAGASVAEPVGGSGSGERSVGVVSSGERAAAALLDAYGPGFPFPDDVRGCVVGRLGADPALVERLGRAADRAVAPREVLDVGSRCMREVRAGPAFVEDLDRDVKGGLSSKQRSCALKGYLALDDLVVADAAAASLNPEAAKAGSGREALAAVAEVLAECQIVVVR